MTPFDEQFVQLCLEIDKHFEGYIDAYIGPADLKTAVSATPPRPPEELLAQCQTLQAAIPTENPARHAWLQAVLRAIHCSIRLIQQESIPYLDEVAQIYDIHPQPMAESAFEQAHRELDTLLPGKGTLAERINSRRERYYLPQEKVLPLLELARDEARQRTLNFIDLPGDNGVEITLTSSQPWAAYNWYKGNGRSHIEFNTDVPISALGLINTFAHEGYPGHHTEAVLKEQKFVKAKGWGEMMVALLHSPSAVIAEGIATTAAEIIFPNGEAYQWTIDVLLPAAEITTEETAETMQRISQASEKLRYVAGNAAIYYHTGQFSKEQAIDYIQSYGLATRERAAKTFSFITHPLFRSYIFTYTQGYDLITAASQNGSKQTIFGRLLTEQILPSQLANKTE